MEQFIQRGHRLIRWQRIGDPRAGITRDAAGAGNGGNRADVIHMSMCSQAIEPVARDFSVAAQNNDVAVQISMQRDAAIERRGKTLACGRFE